jgi:beta-glucosidase
MSRIDEAVTRILRVKMRLGLFEAGKPSSRALAGQWSVLGSPEHRALAREAVRRSLVLLKNQGVLPLKPGGRLLVAGDGADDIARQSGGWTLTWQGTGIDNSNFPGATSLWEGLEQAVTAGGGHRAAFARRQLHQRPDAAVVIFGEKPYAEFQGDRASLQLDPELTRPYETMRKLKERGIRWSRS